MAATNLLMFMLEGFAIASWVYTVSYDGCQPLEVVQS